MRNFEMDTFSTKKRLKKAVAGLLGNPVAFAVTDTIVNRPQFPFVRAIGYHDTPSSFADRFRAHLAWFAEQFVNCDRERLDRFLEEGTWPYDKPGIIISFDDGLRSNAKVAAPMLEAFGFTGWFMVPAIVPETGPGNDRDFADRALIPFADDDPDDRLFMSWQDMRTLSKAGHEICCHSMHHKRLEAALSSVEMIEEIGASKIVLEKQLGHAIDSFAWVGGEDYSFSSAAFAEMKRANYRLIFSTNCHPIVARQTPHCLERNHVDAAFTLNEVRLSIGGAYDLLYRRKRRRTARVIGLTPLRN